MLLRALLAVAAGEAVYGTAGARRIVAFFTGAHQQYAAPDAGRADRTRAGGAGTGRRRLGNHEIARRLVLSEKSVRNHVSAILVKLQIPDRASAVAKARDAGLGTRTRRTGVPDKITESSHCWEMPIGRCVRSRGHS